MSQGAESRSSKLRTFRDLVSKQFQSLMFPFPPYLHLIRQVDTMSATIAKYQGVSSKLLSQLEGTKSLTLRKQKTPPSPPTSECGSTVTEPLLPPPSVEPIYTFVVKPVEGELYSLADLTDDRVTYWRRDIAFNIGPKRFSDPSGKWTQLWAEKQQQEHEASVGAFLVGYSENYSRSSKHPRELSSSSQALAVV